MDRLALMRMAVAALTATGLAPARAGGMHSYAVMDPVLEMKAWDLAVPAGWKAEGTMLPGSSCVSSTSPVVRASSPDGLSGLYLLPRTDWAWGTRLPVSDDCRRLPKIDSARDYLNRLVAIRGLEVVREVPVPELDQARRNMQSMNSRAQGGMRFSIDMARSLVRYSVGAQQLEEWLTVTLSCNQVSALGAGQQHSCSAFVARWFAPLGTLQSKIPQFEAMKMTVNPAWMDRWKQAMVARSQALSRQQTGALLEQGRLAQGQRTKQHQDFMAAEQGGRDRRNQRFVEGQYRKAQNKEDYVDYVLDCQRAYSRNMRVSVGNCPDRETR